MKYDSNLIRGALMNVMSLGVALLAIAAATQAANGAEEGDAVSEPYTWSAELIELEAGDNRATFRSMFASHAAPSAAAQLDPGDRIFLTWSGLRFANSVRALSRDAADAPSSLTLPVRFEGLERDGRYVTFSLDISGAHTDTLSSLQEGHWVTATSPRFPFDTQGAVIAIRPYNDVE